MIICRLTLKKYGVNIFDRLISESLQWSEEEFISMKRYIDFFKFCKMNPKSKDTLKDRILTKRNDAELNERERDFNRLLTYYDSLNQHF